MWKFIGRTMANVGLRMAFCGMRFQGAKAVAVLQNIDDNGTKCVALTAGTEVNTEFLRIAAGLPPEKSEKPVVLFVIFGSGEAWVRVEDSEQKARWYVEGYRSVNATGGISVSRIVNGREDSRVSIPAGEFDTTIPLFPLEDSAA